MIYTVTLNPAIDYVIWVDKLNEGKTNVAENAEVQLGGKGINVSSVLANLGVKNCAMGFLAGFTGRLIEEKLQAMGVDTDFVHLKEGINRINIKLKTDCETEINAQGPTVFPDDWDELLRKLDRLQCSDVLVLSGSVQKSLSSDVYDKILQRMQDKQIMVVVDAVKDYLCNTLKYRPFLIKPNHIELGEIFGKVLSDEDQIKECAYCLQEKGARNILVSMAGKGAILLTEEGKYYKINVPQRKVKNSTGAGDSMVAGFLVGYLKSGDYQTALKMGAAAGSATAFSERLATRDEIMSVLDLL